MTTDNWQQYATKREETAQQVIERHRREHESLLRLLAQARTEQDRAYRCIQGMHNALAKGVEFHEAYHALTVGAAKRFVFEGALDGTEYFVGKPAEVLHAALALPAEQPKRCEHVQHLHVGNNKNFCKACGLWAWASDGIDVGDPGADDRAHARWCLNNLGAWGCGREARGDKWGGPRCDHWCGSTSCPASLKDGRPAGVAFRADTPKSQPPVHGTGGE